METTPRRRAIPAVRLLVALACAALSLAAGVHWGAFSPLERLFQPGDPARLPPLAHAAVAFSWPEFHERVEIWSEDELKAVGELLEGVSVRNGEADLHRALWRLELSFADGAAVSFWITGEHRLFTAPEDEHALPRGLRALLPADRPGTVEWISPGLSAWVQGRVQELDSRFFGELLTWREVSPRFPVGGIAVVRDLETGRSFKVRRHRGDAHADVEPVTAEDSRILKEIYGGEWSWKRRAVVVTVGGVRAAGSMNGMPHGWGDLFDNDFVGHSCIHFWQSRVHTTWREDPGHQLQVLKAAGLLAPALDAASPADLAMWAVAALNHQDVVSLRYMALSARTGASNEAGAAGPANTATQAAGASNEEFSILLSQIALPIRHISYHGARLVGQGERAAAVEVLATVYYHEPDPDQGYSKAVLIRLERESPLEPWRVDLSSLIPLARPGGTEALSDVPHDAAASEALAMGCGEHAGA